MNHEFHFDFFAKRFVFLAISGVLILAGLVGYFVHGGFNLDIQFEGGTQLEIPMQQENFQTADVERYLQGAPFNKAVSVQEQRLYNPDDPANEQITLIVKASKSEALTDDQIAELTTYIDENYGIVEGKNINVRNVEPYIGAETLRKGLIAVVLASALILVYVWIRFSVMSGLSAALCATLALLHDALIMLAYYAITNRPINDAFIAAVLTILGYSINDTIVVYDRIRENSRKAKRMAYPELVNSSLNQTLTRSLNTTITTLICVITVFVFAIIFDISSLQEFCLPLIIGMISGVYSTLFIATPMWAMWQMGKQKRAIASK